MLNALMRIRDTGFGGSEGMTTGEMSFLPSGQTVRISSGNCIDAVNLAVNDKQQSSQIGSPELETKDFHAASAHPTANHADDVTGAVAVTSNGNRSSNPIGDGFAGRDHLKNPLAGELPKSKNADLLAQLHPPADRADGAIVELNATRVRAALEGRMNAHSQDTWKLCEEVIAAFQVLEHEYHKQELSVLKLRDEVSLLQKDNQMLCHRMNDQKSFAAQVVVLQDLLSKIESENGLVLQEVKTLPSVLSTVLDINREKTTGELHSELRLLQEDLRKCRTSLASTIVKSKASSHHVEELKEAIIVLQDANTKLELKSDVIQQQLCKERADQNGSYVDGQQTPSLLESTAKDMFSSIAVFSSLLSKYSDLNGDNGGHSYICGQMSSYDIRVSREHHWTYFLKKQICSILFHDFESEVFARSEITVMFLDQSERARVFFEYFKKCKDKGVWDTSIQLASDDKLDRLFYDYFTLRCPALLPWDLVHPVRELFSTPDQHFGDLVHEMLSRLLPNQQKVVQSLITAAGKVWHFHKLCLSFEPSATIFRVSSGDLFNPDYMENIDALENDDGNSAFKVAFMTYPGFRLRKSIIKCEVYLALGT